jgi:hypothetical protein
MRKKLCPVCGEKVTQTGETDDDRLILSCGDAVWYRKDRLGRTYWLLKRTTGKRSEKNMRAGRSVSDALCPTTTKVHRSGCQTS